MSLAHKTYVLVLDDRCGSFLEIAQVFSTCSVNIKRVSYNKVIDPRTCFIEAEGEPANMLAVDTALEKRGVLPDETQVGHVELVEFSLNNEPGAMIPILELVYSHGFNITYYDARSTPDENRSIRLGIYVEKDLEFQTFFEEASHRYVVRRVEYDRNQHVIDTNLFYLAFAREITHRMGLTKAQEKALLVNSNRIVQSLENTNADPFKPFDYLRQFSRGIDEFRGDSYGKSVRVTRFEAPGGARCTCIEPPAGSDTWVLEANDLLICIDSGYRAFREELLGTLRECYPDWDDRKKALVLTHADIDHAGACDLFDVVYAVGEVLDNFRLEHMGKPGWREGTPNGRAYNQIGMILSGYITPWLDNFTCIGRRGQVRDEPITRCVSADGTPVTLVAEPFHFEVWEGQGGHVRGETVLIDRGQRVCVSGDIFVNVHGETKPQNRFNILAPYLLTSVDSVPDLARTERKYLFGLLDPGDWIVMGGHGGAFPYTRRAAGR